MSTGIDELLHIMTLLRDPEKGCPWDRQQDFHSIAPHTLEECYEVVDAIEKEDWSQLRNELGDLLFQVVFYAQLGKEGGLFDFADVVAEIRDKLLTRHPHVFPDATIASFGQAGGIDAEQVAANWERLKADERTRKAAGDGVAKNESLLDDVPAALPALSRARKLQKRAALGGFDWPDSGGVMAKLREEIAELEQAMGDEDDAAVAEELGDLLFTVVNLSRHLRHDPEASLRAANRKFESRFRQLERRVREQGREPAQLTLEELETHWRQVKDRED